VPQFVHSDLSNATAVEDNTLKALRRSIANEQGLLSLFSVIALEFKVEILTCFPSFLDIGRRHKTGLSDQSERHRISMAGPKQALQVRPAPSSPEGYHGPSRYSKMLGKRSCASGPWKTTFACV
jgi:hypothetical protein